MKRILFLAMGSSANLFCAGVVSSSSYAVGHFEKEVVHLTAEQLVQISDQLIKDDIAEVDIDPEAFDVDKEKPKTYKKNALDDIEFVSER